MNTPETKPSEAAMRAAEKIFPNAVAGQIRNTAELIDAELSTPDLERRAQAAAEEMPLSINLPIEKIKAIILRHFGGLGGSEKLREFKRLCKDHSSGCCCVVCEAIRLCQNQPHEALAQSSDDRRKELVDVLKTIDAWYSGSLDHRPPYVAAARAALKKYEN